MQAKSKKRQRIKTARESIPMRGFTLTEVAIVLGIIGLILGAIWAAASSVYANEKSSKSVRGILVAVQSVRSLYANSNTTGPTPGPITSTGLFPADWQGTKTGVYGNPYRINPTESYSYLFGNVTFFGVELDGITDRGCTALLAYFNASASSSLTGGGIVGLSGSAASAASPTAGTAQIGVSGIVKDNTFATPDACSGGDQNDNVMISFDMSKM